MDRKKFIGSSEIAAVCGLSRWDTPLSLWARKTGLVEADDLSEVECVEWGTRLEGPVAEKFAEKHGVKIMAYKKRFTHPEHDFLSCELDRIITGTETIIEVKTCNAWKAKEWEDDEYPLEYELQVQFALGLSGRKKAWMICLIGGQKYVEKELDFDPEVYQMMVDKAVTFWQMVQDKEAPVAVGADGDILAELYPNHVPETQIELADDEVEQIAEKLIALQSVKGQIKSMEENKKALENLIKQRMEDDELMLAEDFKVTWKTQIAYRVDVKKLREAGLFEKYEKESTSRVLRVSKPKKKEK